MKLGPMSQGNPSGAFSAPTPAGMNGPARSESLQSGLEKLDCIISVSRLRCPTASENLRHWLDGGGRDRVVPASVFQAVRFLLDHLRDTHRPKFITGTKRRLISGELTPGHGGVAIEWTDSGSAPHFTDLFFALGEFTVHSRVQARVDRGDGPLTLRFDHWGVEIADDYDWDPGRWALMPGIGRVTHGELLALEKAGYGRRYRVRSEWATITDPAVTAPATLPAGSY
jgi:hypothetical protein